MQVPIVNNQLIYPCGCKFDVVGYDPIRIAFDSTPSKLPLDCSLTWEVLAGNTKGVFQLETRLGQKASKDLMPEDMEQLAALTTILRPGCLNAKTDGKSATQHYIDRKNKLEEATYYHTGLEDILCDTFASLIYQEQAMQIATKFAGFSLQQGDSLRKSMGKKKPELMAKVKTEFIDGCKQVGILSDEEAAEIFGQIEKSQRYSFNKSHAVSYGYISYMTAYQKAHFPVSFFTSYLFYAKDKQKKFDEIKLLINNSRLMEVVVNPPDFRHIHPHFKRIPKQASKEEYDTLTDQIYFGFGDIKGIGNSKVNTILKASYQAEQALGKSKECWDWLEFLVYFTPLADNTITTAIIESGCLDYMKESRQKMLYEYSIYNKLTDKEKIWIQQNLKKDITRLIDLMEWIINLHEANEKGPCHNKARVLKIKELHSLIKSPPCKLIDDPAWVSSIEEARLGISLTTNIVDNCMNADSANCSCIEFATNKVNRSLFIIPVQIDEIKTYMTKNNEEMAFIEMSDGEATISGVIFPNKWEEIKKDNTCVQNNIVMVCGERSKKNDGIIVSKISQLI